MISLPNIPETTGGLGSFAPFGPPPTVCPTCGTCPTCGRPHQVFVYPWWQAPTTGGAVPMPGTSFYCQASSDRGL